MPLTFNFDCILNRREKKLITFYFLKKYFFFGYSNKTYFFNEIYAPKFFDDEK